MCQVQKTNVEFKNLKNTKCFVSQGLLLHFWAQSQSVMCSLLTIVAKHLLSYMVFSISIHCTIFSRMQSPAVWLVRGGNQREKNEEKLMSPINKSNWYYYTGRLENYLSLCSWQTTLLTKVFQILIWILMVFLWPYRSYKLLHFGFLVFANFWLKVCIASVLYPKREKLVDRIQLAWN